MLKHLTKSILLIELRSIFKEIMNDLDFQNNLPVNYYSWGFFPWNAEQPVQGMEIQRKSIQEKTPADKRYLLILDLNLLTSYVKGKHSMSRKCQSLAVH